MKKVFFLSVFFIFFAAVAYTLPTVKDVLPNYGPYISYSPTPKIKIVFSEPVSIDLPGAVKVNPGYVFEVYTEPYGNTMADSLLIVLKNVPYPASFTIYLDHTKIKNLQNQYLDGENTGSPSDYDVTFKFNEPYVMLKAGEECWFPIDQDVLGSITIYSFDGRKLTTLHSNRWDGYSKGVMLKSGGYLFIVQDASGSTIMKGRLTLIK